MVGDRLEHIETTLNSLVIGQEELRAGQEELRAGQEELRAGQEELRTGLGELRAGLGELRTGLGELHKRQDGFERRLTRVEVQQEAMRDDIKLIADTHGATQAAMERGFDALKTHIDRRIDPLELAVRKLMGT